MKKKYLLNFILILIAVFFQDCSHSLPGHYTHDVYTNLRRPLAAVHIDDATCDSPGTIVSSQSYQLAIGKANTVSFQETWSNIYNPENKVNYTCRTYTPPHMLSWQFSIAPINYFSGGLSIDASVGKIKDIPATSRLNHTVFEISWYVRASSKFNRLSFALRPELILYTFNAEMIAVTNSNQLNAVALHDFNTSIRTIASARFEITPVISVFAGIQHKSQDYAIIESVVASENTFSPYFGTSISLLRFFYGNIYLITPFPSDYTKNREQIQLGTAIVFRLTPD